MVSLETVNCFYQWLQYRLLLHDKLYVPVNDYKMHK